MSDFVLICPLSGSWGGLNNEGTLWQSARQELRDQAVRHVEVAKLCSVYLAFNEIEEVRNEAWMLYHGTPQP
jgi:hypothetical protein